MIIKIIRHGESKANTGEIHHGSIGDHLIELTELGKKQAYEAGVELVSQNFNFDNCLLYSSPYKRALQTMDNILDGAKIDKNKLQIYQDPRLREVDHGYSNIGEQDEMRKKHGWFYYRFKGGESPADCYDRCCHFIDSLMREVNRRSPKIENSNTNADGKWHYEEEALRPNILLVMHGITMRCFVTRFMHLTVENFESLANPKNCDIVTISPLNISKSPQFSSGHWGVHGLRFRNNNRKE